MRQNRSPTLRELKHGLVAPREFWDDPELAPAPRREKPLTAWT